ELIPKTRIQMLDGFAVIPPAQSRSPLSGATGNHRRKAGIASARPEHGFAEAGDAQDGDAFRIHGLIGFQVIHGPAQPPGPSRDRSPLVRRRLALPRLEV